METDRREQPQRSRVIRDSCPGAAPRSPHECVARMERSEIRDHRSRIALRSMRATRTHVARRAASGERAVLTSSAAGRRGRRAVPARAGRAAGRTPVSPAVAETAPRREDAAGPPEGRARALRAARGAAAVDRVSDRVSALRYSRHRRRAKCRPWSGVPRQHCQHAREPTRSVGVGRQMGGVPWPHMRSPSPGSTHSNSR